MNLYKVKDWQTLYENNRTRELKNMAWVPVPNTHDGDGYTDLVQRKNGAALLGAWVVILQVASKCEPRGTLLRDNGKPHCAASIARMTRLPEDVIQDALDVCTNDIQWLEIVRVAEIPQDDAEIPQEGALFPHPADEEGKGREGKEGKGTIAPLSGLSLQTVFDKWNESAEKSGLPQCLVVSDKRRRQIQARLRDEFFVKNWQEALRIISESTFCKGINDRAWKASFDWFITPDVVAKAIEGKYSGKTPQKPIARPLFIKDATYDASKDPQ